jgi:hypothetical protein
MSATCCLAIPIRALFFADRRVALIYRTAGTLMAAAVRSRWRPSAAGQVTAVFIMASGRRILVLNIVDDVTCECLAAVPDTRSRDRGLSGNCPDPINKTLFISLDPARTAIAAWAGDDNQERPH